MKKHTGRHIAGAVVAGLLILVLLLCAVYPRAAKAVFRNLTVRHLRLDETPDWDGGSSYEHLAYASDSPSQYLDLYVPETEDRAKPNLFVMIHGGGFISGDSQTRQVQFMYRFFRDRGYACASVNYRLAQEAAFPAGLSDCKAAIRYLRAHAEEYGFDADRIAVWGESAGGYLAVMCAVTEDTEFMDVDFIGQERAGDVSARVDVLADYYGHIDNGVSEDWKVLGIPDLVIEIANSWISGDVLQGYENVESLWMRKNISDMTQAELSRIDPYWYIDKNDMTGLSVWIVHGDCDITVPYLHSERLRNALADKPGVDQVSYHLIPGMGHASDPLYSDELLTELDGFLQEQIRSSDKP